MRAAKKVSPEDYILTVLSPQERLEAAFNVAREAAKDSTVKPADVRAAVEKVRKRAFCAVSGKQLISSGNVVPRSVATFGNAKANGSSRNVTSQIPPRAIMCFARHPARREIL